MERKLGVKDAARILSVEEFVHMWKNLHHLDPEDAEEFAREVEASRKVLSRPPQGSWD